MSLTKEEGEIKYQTFFADCYKYKLTNKKRDKWIEKYTEGNMPTDKVELNIALDIQKSMKYWLTEPSIDGEKWKNDFREIYSEVIKIISNSLKYEEMAVSTEKAVEQINESIEEMKEVGLTSIETIIDGEAKTTIVQTAWMCSYRLPSDEEAKQTITYGDVKAEARKNFEEKLPEAELLNIELLEE